MSNKQASETKSMSKFTQIANLLLGSRQNTASYFSQNLYPCLLFVTFFYDASRCYPIKINSSFNFESHFQVIRSRETRDGIVDLNHLENLLKQHQNSSQQMIGCFSAASNITGIRQDENAITILLHKYGAFAFWDFATAGKTIFPLFFKESNLSFLFLPFRK